MIRPFHGRALLPQDRIDQIRYRRCNACQNRRHWCCRGAVAVEAALILPALLMIAAVATGSWRISEVKADAQSAAQVAARAGSCLLYTSPSPRDRTRSRMPSSA